MKLRCKLSIAYIGEYCCLQALTRSRYYNVVSLQEMVFIAAIYIRTENIQSTWLKNTWLTYISALHYLRNTYQVIFSHK